jgi:hypothetical protein
MDDILDASLAGDSPALNFGSATRVPTDSTDLDGDGDTTEPIPYDLLHKARVLYTAPDAGAFEFVDLATFAPTLASPAAGTRVKSPLSVSFTLVEAALPGSVSLTFDDGVTQRVMALTTSQESVGSHSFSFDPANPVGSSGGAIGSGPAIPDGSYTVTLSYQDTFSHPAATASSAGVVIDNVTQAPTLSAPVSGLPTKSPVSVSFNLPEAGLAGTLTLTFDDGTTQRVLGLAAAQATAGAHSFSFNPATPTTSSGGAITSGSAIPEGLYSVTLSYKDAVGNTAATATATNVRIDLTTQPPTLTAPLAGTATGNPVSVAFSLPEAVLPGSVKLAFSGSVSRTLTLASSFESAGAKSFNFNPANPLGVAVVGISGGTTIPDGGYTVTLSYQDALGNVSASAAAGNVRIDTAAPTFSLPGTLTVEATSAAGAVVNYNASASDSGSGLANAVFTPPSGSIFPIGTTLVTATATDNVGNTSTNSFNVTVRDTTAPVVATHPDVLAEATGPGGAIVTYSAGSASDAVGVTLLAYSEPSGTSFPIGKTTVLIFALDAANNLGIGSFTVTVVDTTKPTITAPAGGFSPGPLKTPAGAGGTVLLPDYRGQAVTADAVGVGGVSQSPEPGTLLRAGPHTVTLTVTDISGNANALSFSVPVEIGDPVAEPLVAKGAPVPGAGVPGSGIPAGATWKTFGVPAINRQGEMAFVASLKHSRSGTLTGIFAGPTEAPVLLVKKGDSAPGTDGAAFVSFKDPLFNEAGRVAFVATISGAGVTGENNRGLWTNAFGADPSVFQLLARTGGPVPGVSRALWMNFQSVTLTSGELNLVGTMMDGANWGLPGPDWVRPANALVLCRYSAGAPSGDLLLRNGQSLTVDGVRATLTNFVTLANVNGSPGQRRQPLNGGVHVKAMLADGRACLLNNIGAAGLSQVEAVTGDTLTNEISQPAGTLASLGIAADATGGAWGSVFKAALKGAGTNGADNAALVAASSDGLSILARKGDEVDAARAPGALIKAYPFDPVAVDGGFACVVSLSGTGVLKSNDTGLLWRGNGFSGLLAREGDSAPGAGGARYGRFVSLALPEGATGPIFVASLLSPKTGVTGRVTARNNFGLWAADTSGVARLLLRKGDLLDGKKVAGFTVLPMVPGSPAQARSYNDAGDIVAKVNFTDGSQSIVRIRVP